MKNIFLLTLLLTLCFSCKKKEEICNTGIIGTWQLIEAIGDPGDGSGTWQPVTSAKTITFASGGHVSSNGKLCTMSSDADGPTHGTYSDIEKYIVGDDCTSWKIQYELDGNTLVLRFPCIEACAMRFRKI